MHANVLGFVVMAVGGFVVWCSFVVVSVCFCMCVVCVSVCVCAKVGYSYISLHHRSSLKGLNNDADLLYLFLDYCCSFKF